jgi:hypothetical protein
MFAAAYWPGPDWDKGSPVFHRKGLEEREHYLQSVEVLYTWFAAL